VDQAQAISLATPPASRLAVVACGHAPGEDERLLERIADGDHDAFEILYRRYARPVLALAQRRLGDAGRAEEALQEAFVSVWRSASTFRPERGTATTWLYTVARNAIADRGRRRQEPPAEPSDQPSMEAGPDERAEREWLRWRVHSALERLSESERELIVLAYWGGLSQSEIADRLDAPLGTVKTRTRTALSRLATLLDEELQ
jgi:RNA polymerase sigma-70 factor, ECF subfamily